MGSDVVETGRMLLTAHRRDVSVYRNRRHLQPERELERQQSEQPPRPDRHRAERDTPITAWFTRGARTSIASPVRMREALDR
jgi:hypothetical protein